MHDHAAHERMQRLTGIALMCGAVMCFALLDTMAKYLNLHMSTLQVVWARYTGAFQPLDTAAAAHHGTAGSADRTLGAAAFLDTVQFRGAALSPAR
jgi:hypothetical protein